MISIYFIILFFFRNVFWYIHTYNNKCRTLVESSIKRSRTLQFCFRFLVLIYSKLRMYLKQIHWATSVYSWAVCIFILSRFLLLMYRRIKTCAFLLTFTVSSFMRWAKESFVSKMKHIDRNIKSKDVLLFIKYLRMVLKIFISSLFLTALKLWRIFFL